MPKPTQKVAEPQAKRPMAIPLYGPVTWRNTISWLILIALVLVVRWAWFEPYTIPSGSMEPTLHGDPRLLRGDRVFIDKWTYGLRVPFANARLLDGSEPQRWDIVVFRSPQEDAVHPILIKRVVGLPGDRINIGEDGNIWVNGAIVEPPAELKGVLHYVRQITPGELDVRKLLLSYAATMQPEQNVTIVTDNPDGGKSHLSRMQAIKQKMAGKDLSKLTDTEVIEATAGAEPSDLAFISHAYAADMARKTPFRYGIETSDQYALIPPGHYLMLGDNSNNSIDGRFFGWVPEANIYGRAYCIWWPLNRLRDFTGFSRAWYGIFFIYIIPAIVILWMLLRQFFGRTCKVYESALHGMFAPGERLFVDRRAYGIAIPFVSSQRPTRPPKKNDIVLFQSLDGATTSEPRLLI